MTYDLFEIAWKSVVTAGLALLLLAALKNRSAAERSWVAHAGLLATLLLPLAVVLIPRWHVEAPASVPNMLVSAAAAPAMTSEPAVAAAPAALAPPAAPSFELETVTLWIYFIPAALLLLVTSIAVIRLFALRGRATVLVEQNWLSALAHAQRRMGFKHGTALLVSNELTSPVSWGILRPIILLNEEAVNAASEAEAIIAHELAHVARLDWAKLLIARAATALFWFNPLVWLLARQCHQLREEAADDAVLRSNVVSTDYAALLVGAARHESKGLLLAANGVAPGPSSLKRRVARVLDASSPRAPARIAWASACSVGAILVAAPLSALTPIDPLPASVAQIANVEPPSLVAPRAGGAVISLPGMTLSAGNAPAAGEAMPAATITVVEAGAPTVSTAPMASAAPAAALASATAGGGARPADRRVTPDDLMAMNIHGITPEYIDALAAADPRLRGLSVGELVAMRIHGVSAEKVRAYVQLGYRSLSHDDLLSMSIHGVSPFFIREIGELGYRGLSVDQLTAMRIHGVSPGYIREFQAAGHSDLTAAELIDMRIQGVRAKRGADRAHASQH